MLNSDDVWQVRIYTPKRVFQELEVAKDEYIRANLGVRKDQKILLPKLIESFSKDSGLCPNGVMDMILESLPESLRKSVKKCQLAKSRKCIEWIPHNFTFRYLISKDMMKWLITWQLCFLVWQVMCLILFVQSRKGTAKYNITMWKHCSTYYNWSGVNNVLLLCMHSLIPQHMYMFGDCLTCCLL